VPAIYREGGRVCAGVHRRMITSCLKTSDAASLPQNSFTPTGRSEQRRAMGSKLVLFNPTAPYDAIFKRCGGRRTRYPTREEVIRGPPACTFARICMKFISIDPIRPDLLAQGLRGELSVYDRQTIRVASSPDPASRCREALELVFLSGRPLTKREGK